MSVKYRYVFVNSQNHPGSTMNKTIRKAMVAAAALIAVTAVPVASDAPQAWRGGYGDWPVSSPIRSR
ncbi:MAG: hypothetical protein QM695_01525 [Micropruina sp.]